MTVVSALARSLVFPQETIDAAKAAGLPLAHACAMLTLETAGGHNEFGHDPGNAVQGGEVTEERYRELRASVAAGHPSQGVGPCQLTSVSLLDAADKIGGAWNVKANMTIGFRYLAALQREFGSAQLGFQHYNGSGPAAVAYGQRAMALAAQFAKIISANTPPPDPHHYAWFDGTVRNLGGKHHGSERNLVKEYDRKRKRWKVFRGRLGVLRDDMGILAGRLETVMHEDQKGNDANRRGWRHAQLAGRASGRRYV